MNVIIKPNFLYLGAPKAGSTWLFHLVRLHPLAFAPPAKDLYFFDRYFHRGVDWYHNHFKGAEDYHQAVGEFSHDYLYSPTAAMRIHQYRQKMRLIVVLRNPLDRAVSEIGFLARNGAKLGDLDRILDRHPEIVAKSLYASHVRRYRDLFPADQIHVFFYDDLKADPEKFAARFFDCLDLPSLPEAFVTRSSNAASSPRARWLAAIAKRFAIWTRAVGGADLVGRVKSARFVNQALYRRGAPDLSDFRTALSKRYGVLFEADISALEAQLGRSLSHWTASLLYPGKTRLVVDDSEEERGWRKHFTHRPELGAESVKEKRAQNCEQQNG